MRREGGPLNEEDESDLKSLIEAVRTIPIVHAVITFPHESKIL